MEGLIIQKKTILISVIAIVIIVSALSGCLGSSGTTQTSTPTATATGTPSLAAGSGDKITVTQSGNTMTIKGGVANKVVSEKFPMDADAWYMITYEYNGPEWSNFITMISTPEYIANDEAIGGLLPMLLEPGKGTIIKEKGVYKSTDYQLLADTCGGPWTVTIVKNPAPAASGQASFSHKAADSTNSISPYFHLNKGSATFTVNQQLPGQYSVAADVQLYNADTGEWAADITHNDNTATITRTVDIEADGNYIMGVTCGGDWQISFTQ
ncbi:hypothetical protein [Methanocella paludicola]|uniref:hypothetical protein n=1 Tax=Methanocella paludicola TaxID=570267 RepID=UPI0010081BAF|nr:hypothetical protein [Methanocella paludicola]